MTDKPVREIKFRAWDEDGYMFTPSSISFNEHGEAMVYDKEGNFGENGSAVWLMQYTGLKDKNDKEIYEGDIIEVTPVTKWGKPYKVQKFPSPKGAVTWADDRFTIHGVSALNYHAIRYGAVIGNIYETPELLK